MMYTILTVPLALCKYIVAVQCNTCCSVAHMYSTCCTVQLILHESHQPDIATQISCKCAPVCGESERRCYLGTAKFALCSFYFWIMSLVMSKVFCLLKTGKTLFLFPFFLSSRDGLLPIKKIKEPHPYCTCNEGPAASWRNPSMQSRVLLEY